MALNTIALIIAAVLVVWASRLILKGHNPQSVLFGSGVIMLFIAKILIGKLPSIPPEESEGVIDVAKIIVSSFSETMGGVGLMIMFIGGYVKYSYAIGATSALVNAIAKPLHKMKGNPYFIAVLILPFGHILSLFIPSAAGLGLIMMTTVFPILRKLGVSALTGVSVIVGSTSLCVGPASVITNSAVSIMDIPIVPYFIEEQIPLVWPTLFVLMVVYYFSIKFFERNIEVRSEEIEVGDEESISAPKFYALLPLLPLVLLIVFSKVFEPVGVSIQLNTTQAMLISTIMALVVELIRNPKASIDSLKGFWEGMANIFKSVVTLILTASVFAKGIIALGVLDGLSSLIDLLSIHHIFIGITMSVFIYLASIVMGSANAAFFAFGPLIPNIAEKAGASALSMLLPMNIAASMGRAISPISGVVLATSEIGEVDPFEVVRRNIPPMVIGLAFLLSIHYAF